MTAGGIQVSDCGHVAFDGLPTPVVHRGLYTATERPERSPVYLPAMSTIYPFALLLLLLIPACSETTSPAALNEPTVPGSDTLAMSAFIDNVPWIGRDSLQVTHDEASRTLVVNFSSTENKTLRQLTIVLYGVMGPGTYTITDSTKGNVRYVLREDKETSDYQGLGVTPSPTVTLDTFSDSGAKGSFSFNAVAVSGARTGDTAKIRGGRFRIEK